MSGLLLLGADVDLEVHVPLAQDLGVGDDPVPVFEGDVVADLQDLADVVRRHVTAVRKVDAVAVAADHGRSTTPPGASSSTEAHGLSEASGSVEGGSRLVAASLAGPGFGSKRYVQRAQLTPADDDALVAGRVVCRTPRYVRRAFLPMAPGGVEPPQQDSKSRQVSRLSRPVWKLRRDRDYRYFESRQGSLPRAVL